MKNNLAVLAITLMLVTFGVQANFSTVEVNILNTDPGAVQYVNFDVTSAGSFNIQALGEPTFGLPYNPDPEIFLFSSSLNPANLVASGVDGAGNFESFISNSSLNVGSYILAVSGFDFTLNDAISGLNPDITDFGKVNITIASQTGIAQLTAVPVPGALWLLGSGLLGLLSMRSKLKDS